MGPRCCCIYGGQYRHQTVADYVPFDGGQGHDGDLATQQILLRRQSLVSCEEDFETIVLGSLQKLAIFQPGPTLVTHREYFVTAEMIP